MSHPTKRRDLTTGDGALRHVALIRQYWWSRGHMKVDAWVVREGMNRKAPIFGVRSNLINGRPA